MAEQDQQIITTLATKVMGWERFFHEGMQLWGWKQDSPYFFTSHWNPLHNIDDAWRIVKKLKADGWLYESFNDRFGREYFRFAGHLQIEGNFLGEGTTLPEAISDAARKMINNDPLGLKWRKAAMERD